MATRQIGGFALACVLLTVTANAVDKDDAKDPESLVSKARTTQNMWSDGMPPARMVAEIQIADSKGGMVRGEYVINWVSPSRWREEVHFANYDLLRVHQADGYWEKSGLDYKPYVIFQIERLLHYDKLFETLTNQELGQVKEHQKNGSRQKCVEIKWPARTDRILCFDGVSGNLLSADYPTPEHHNPPDVSRIELDAYKTVGEKSVPFEIRALRSRRTVASVKVLEFTQDIEQPPALFDAPANSTFWPGCDHVQRGELVNHISPKYPVDARMKGEKGTVTFYGVVEADGTLSHLTVIKGATPLLEAAAGQALSHWQYKPASCGSTSVCMETSIDIDFWLER